MSDPTPLVVGVLAVVVGPDLHAPLRETAIHGVTGQVRRERAAGEGA